MKVAAIAAVLAASVSLASCTTDDGQIAAAKAYDRVCAAEPPLYASFVAVATAKGTSEKTLAKAAGLHSTVTNFCTNRPTDFVTALVTLSVSYAQFVAINASVQKERK